MILRAIPICSLLLTATATVAQGQVSATSIAGCYRIEVANQTKAGANGSRLSIPAVVRLHDTIVGTTASGLPARFVAPPSPGSTLASGWSLSPSRTVVIWWSTGSIGAEVTLRHSDSGTTLHGQAQYVADVILGATNEPAVLASAHRVECPISLRGPPTVDSVVVSGTVIDRTTRSPLAGAYLAFRREARGWTIADSLGRFSMVPNVRGRQPLVVACPRPRGVWGETLDTLALDIHAGLDTAFTIPVAGVRCDLPEFAERRLDLSGFFSVGWEENRFFPDPDSLGRPIIWGGNEASRHAEVAWTAAGEAQRPAWPEIRPLASSYCYRVRWIGTLVGPGLKDRIPPGSISAQIAAYRFSVDSTMSVEPAPAASCKPTQ